MIARLAVSSKGLVKRYGSRRALDGFTLDVPEGCVMGLVGPNGAGKTTWMMAVAGLVRTDAGTVGLFGMSQPFVAAAHSGRLAILPQDSELPLESTPEGFLRGLARLQGLGADAAKASARKVLDAVNLADRARASIRFKQHGIRREYASSSLRFAETRFVSALRISLKTSARSTVSTFTPARWKAISSMRTHLNGVVRAPRTPTAKLLSPLTTRQSAANLSMSAANALDFGATAKSAVSV